MRYSVPKILAWIFGIVAGLLLMAAICWHFFKKDLANPNSKIAKPLLTQKLKKMLLDASDRLYHISYSKFDVNIDKGTCLVTSLKLIPDSVVLARLIALHHAPPNVLYGTIDSLEIMGFGFIKTQSGRKFNGGNITIYHPVITLVNKRYNDPDTTAKPSLLMGMVKNMFKGGSIKSMLIYNLMLKVINKNEGKNNHTAFKHLSVYLAGIAIDSSINKRVSEGAAEKNEAPGLEVETCRISTPDSLYYIYLNSMRLSFSLQDMLINKVAITPRLSIPAFYRKVRYNKDRIHMVFNRMVISHIDIEQFLRSQKLHIRHISIANSWAEVYNNYNWPNHMPPLRMHGYSQERLQRLAFDITIDTMVMHKGYISYKIATKKSDSVANFFLTNTESQFYNITNNTIVKSKKRYATAYMETRVMGAADLKVKFEFDLKSKNGAMNYSMSMGKLDGRALNPLSVPLALASIRSADIKKMYIRVNLNEQMATGNIDMYYENMKIDLLKRDVKTDTLKKKKTLSFITNALLPNDNPNKDGKLRKGPIYVIRPPRMSFLGFIYKNMLDGLTSLVSGFDQHKEKPDKNTIISIGKKFIKPKTK